MPDDFDRGPAIEEFERNNEEEDATADANRRDFDAKVVKDCGPCQKKEDNDEKGNDATPSRHGPALGLCLVWRDGKEDRDAGKGGDNDKELDNEDGYQVCPFTNRQY